MITTQKLARQLCALEGLKEQVNIAQMNEIVSKLPEMVYNNRKEMADLMEYLFKNFMKSGYTVNTNTDRKNGRLANFYMSVYPVGKSGGEPEEV